MSPLQHALLNHDLIPQLLIMMMLLAHCAKVLALPVILILFAIFLATTSYLLLIFPLFLLYLLLLFLKMWQKHLITLDG